MGLGISYDEQRRVLREKLLRDENTLMIEKLQGKESSLAFPETQKPAVTREAYERGREVLDALPPGVYLKCSSCFKWQRGGEFYFKSNEFLCERCA